MLDGRSVLLPVSELAGGARIRHIFQQIFVNSLNQLDPSRLSFLAHPTPPELAGTDSGGTDCGEGLLWTFSVHGRCSRQGGPFQNRGAYFFPRKGGNVVERGLIPCICLACMGVKVLPSSSSIASLCRPGRQAGGSVRGPWTGTDLKPRPSGEG